MIQVNSYMIDTTSNNKYYIIYKDNKELMKINKVNSIEDVKRMLGDENNDK